MFSDTRYGDRYHNIFGTRTTHSFPASLSTLRRYLVVLWLHGYRSRNIPVPMPVLTTWPSSAFRRKITQFTVDLCITQLPPATRHVSSAITHKNLRLIIYNECHNARVRAYRDLVKPISLSLRSFFSLHQYPFQIKKFVLAEFVYKNIQGLRPVYHCSLYQ